MAAEAGTFSPWYGLLVIGLGCALIFAGVYRFQGKLIFKPSATMHGNPSEVGLDFESISIQTESI